jgi:hypothetical protein
VFRFSGGRTICRHSGLRHSCSDAKCLTVDERSGETVCTWTGLVNTAGNSRLDCSLANNISGQRGDPEAGCFGLNTVGYLIPGTRKALRYGSSRRGDTGRSGEECRLVQGTVMVRCSDAVATAAVGRRRKRERSSIREREEVRRNGVSRPSVFAPSRVKPLVGAHVPNTPASRNAATAAEMVWCLYMDAEIRAVLRREAQRKRERAWKSVLRRAVREQRCYLCYTAVLREWAEVHRATFGAWDIADDRAEQPPDAPPADASKMAGMRVRTTVRDELCRAIVAFLLDGWDKLSLTAAWKSGPPDFASYVMGAIYAARDGGIELGGHPIIPETPFFRHHTPAVQQLSTLCGHIELRDCRTSAYGRARIMEGSNAIRRALLQEQHSGATSIADLAFAVPAPLRRTYADPRQLAPWHTVGACSDSPRDGQSAGAPQAAAAAAAGRGDGALG